MRAWFQKGIPWRVMGGGSNLLVADEGIPEAVLRVVSEKPDCEWLPDGVAVAAGTSLDDLARLAAEGGYSGLEFASGIPGTVGGGVCGNAGAFGAALGDVVEGVEVVTPDGHVQRLLQSELSFDYRSSSLQHLAAVVTRVWFQLGMDNAARLLAVREDILAQRRDKHPDWRVLPTVGSFFKNLPPGEEGGRRQAAGKYLEKAGAKQMREGCARVFEKHANIVIAEEGSTARDVAVLTSRMAQAVQKQFDIILEPEVRFWGPVAQDNPWNGVKA